MKTQQVKKIIVVLGPTASGKSDFAVFLAKNFNGEIISADSRQVYKGMDLGTGKVPKDKGKRGYFYEGIRHYLLDVVSPKRKFSVAEFVSLAKKALKKIFKKGKIPIVCGGSWFYIYALVDGYCFPKVKPDWKLRRELEKKSKEELFEMLKKLDPQRAKTVDPENKRRLIRAIEIAKKLGKVPKLRKRPLPYPILFLGIEKDFAELKKLIRRRLLKRIKEGMIEEVKNLKKKGISFKRLEEFGLEYYWVAQYLQNKISKKEMIEKLQKAIEHFAKRQIKIFKKDKRIHWVKTYREGKKLVKNFLLK